METKTLTCIGCPLGCSIQAEIEQTKIISVTGHTCKRGEDYARKELTNPTRIVTGTVRVTGGSTPVVSVKTASDIPKGKIRDVMECIHALRISVPVHSGDVLCENAGETGVAIVATKDAE